MNRKTGLIIFSVTVFSLGLTWIYRSLKRWAHYDLSRDFKEVFLTLRPKYKHGVSGENPTLIFPVLICLGALFLFFWALFKIE